MTDLKLEHPGGGPVSIALTGLQMNISQGNLTAWRVATFAPKWFNDALSEANHDGPDARRREILFAVACAESYLYEWVRDDVLKGNYSQLDSYFGRMDGIKDKWKRVTKQLREENLISGVQDFGCSTWDDFCKLVLYRNGLLHGGASRPDTADIEQGKKPTPSPDELQTLECRWACRVVRDLIKELHDAAGTPGPDWLCKEFS